MSNLYGGHSIDAFYQVSVHLAKHFQRNRFFRNRPIRNKNCLWRPCLLMDRDKMSNLYKGLSLDASYQVSVHLAEEFQRRRLKCEKLTDDGRQVMAKARWAKNENNAACPQVFSSGGTCTLLPSFLGVHPNFWGCNVPSNTSFGGTKKINCIFSTQGRAPCCFL